MKITEKPFLVGKHHIGTYKSYDEIDDELKDPQPGDRVLPAPFFYEKRLFFWLVKKHHPNTNKHFINGGYEVRDASGAIRCYDLDQVIIHPEVIKHSRMLEKMKHNAEKARIKSRIKNEIKPDNVKTLTPCDEGEIAQNLADKSIFVKSIRGRGRPPLSLQERQARQKIIDIRLQKSNGKRGRPRKYA